MELTSLVFVAAFVASLTGALLVFALWRHKQASAGQIKLLGELGLVETKLDPEGAIIVGGELWRARSNDGASIAAHSRVRVVRIQGHIAMVEIPD